MPRIHLHSFIRNFIAIVAALSSLITLYSFFCVVPTAITNDPVLNLIYLTLACIFLSLVLSREKRKVKIKINNDTQLNVQVGNLGDYENRVIPVNDYFDTRVNESIVSSGSLHGKFIKNVFGGNTELLEQLMDSQLDKIQHAVNDKREIERKKYYPLGTTIKISHEGKDYYLVALTRFDSNNKASLKGIEYQRVITSLLDFIAIHSQGKRISLPLIGGSSRSGLKYLSKQQKLELIILSMLLSENLSIDQGLDIVISEDDWKCVSLNRVKYHMIS